MRLVHKLVDDGEQAYAAPYVIKLFLSLWLANFLYTDSEYSFAFSEAVAAGAFPRKAKSVRCV